MGVGFDTANANRDYHFAVTWKESTGQMLLYENGTYVATLSVDPVNDAMSNFQDVNVWLGRSNWTGDDNFQGEYDEFRIYNHILPADQVAASYQAGPNPGQPVSFTINPQNRTVSELGSATFSAAAEGGLPFSLQWYRGTTAIADATNTSVTLTNIPASYNGAQIYLVGSNLVSGLPTLTTSLVATLTVNADLTAPTLTSARLDTLSVAEVTFSEPVLAGDLTLANFSLSGPAGSPTLVSVAPGSLPNRAILTLSGPIIQPGYFTVTVSGVRDIAPSGNVITPGSAISFWNISPDGLSHRYTFNNPVGNATGATVPDVIGTANGTVKNGTGTTTFTGDKVTLSGGSSSGAPYVDLPNGLLSGSSTNNGGSGQITLEGWVKVTGVRNWSRIYDFGSTGPCCAPGGEITGPGGSGDGIDYMFYSAMNGTTPGTRRVDITNRDQGDHATAGSDFGTSTFGQEFHFAVTWDELSGTVVAYENGIQVASFSTVAAMSEINDVNVWLGRSTWLGDENLQGEFNEFRLYNRVLGLSEVQFNKAGGPDNALGAAQSIDLVITNVSFYTNSVRQVPVLVSFSNAGTQNVAALSAVTYTSTDPSVAEITAGGVLRTYGVGSARVTANFNGLSDFADIVVSADNVPPSIVKVRGEGVQYIEVIYSEPVEEASGAEPFAYQVTTPDGTAIDVEDAQISSDGTRVLLRLASGIPPVYITVTVFEVADLLGNISASTSGSFLNYMPVTMKHRYTFNNSTNAAAANTTVRDAVGSADGTVYGAPSIYTGDRVVLFGGSSGSALCGLAKPAALHEQHK